MTAVDGETIEFPAIGTLEFDAGMLGRLGAAVVAEPKLKPAPVRRPRVAVNPDAGGCLAPPTGKDFTQDRDLRCRVFEGEELAGANFQRCELQEARFHGAHLVEASFLLANLESARFNGADLRGAVLWGAHVFRAQFTEADLRGALLPSPAEMLTAWWINVCASDDPGLVADLINYDMANYPPEIGRKRFGEWARNGGCPYADVRVGRAASFPQSEGAYKPERPLCTPWNLMERVFAASGVKWDGGRG